MTGANPTDRGELGRNRRLVVDGKGKPLGLPLTGGDCNDGRMLTATLTAVPGDRTGRRGRPRSRPDELHADEVYDHRRYRRECPVPSIMPRIARRGVRSDAHLGRHNWIVEYSVAWPARFRRLTTRYERHADLHLAFTMLACFLICSARLKRLCRRC